MRGRGRSEKPPGAESYGIANMVADVTGIMDALGIERAHVVGHDWGAAVAWVLASIAPQRVNRLVCLSVGFPGAAGRPDLERLQKAWYQVLFQFPFAEELFAKDGWYLFRLLLEGEDVEAYLKNFEEPGSLTAALNWYRANLKPENLMSPPPALPPVQAPTMGIWSSGDVALTEQAMTASKDRVAGEWRYERLEGVSHWIPSQAPERLNELLLSFLGRP